MSDDDFHIPLGNNKPVPHELARDLWNHLAKKQGNENKLAPLVSNMLAAKGWRSCSKSSISAWHAAGWPGRVRPDGKQPNAPHRVAHDKSAVQGAIANHIMAALELPDSIPPIDQKTTDAELGQIFNREVLLAGIALARAVQKRADVLALANVAGGLMESFAIVANKVHMLGDPLLKMVPADPDKTINGTLNGGSHPAIIEESPLTSHFRNAKAKAAAAA